MIVHRIFKKGAGNTERLVSGWYLFGLIPLYVKIIDGRRR